MNDPVKARAEWRNALIIDPSHYGAKLRYYTGKRYTPRNPRSTAEAHARNRGTSRKEGIPNGLGQDV